ncbi:DUF1631 family protein [Chitinimonas sp.]|uniref:DUF1631 family protein n=1 Tax=Chitinimonas sp. TaxID=1934313 RepID=UPI002F93E256
MESANLLAEVRAQFEEAFNSAQPTLFERTAAQLLVLADKAPSVAQMGLLFDARTALLTGDAELRAEVARQLARLLDRSLQTAYNRERPSGGLSLPPLKLSLLDTSVIEAKLALEGLTTQLRNAAEADLRDFNIRVAFLYQQPLVTERENPFRPYVLACSYISAVAARGLTQELCVVLARELVRSLCSEVEGIYQRLNALLAENQISAELPVLRRATVGDSDLAEDVSAAVVAQARARIAADAPRQSRNDLLLRWVQMKTRPEAYAQARGEAETEAVAADEQAVLGGSWLGNVPNAGSLLRDLFGQAKPGQGGAARELFSTYSGSTVLADAIGQMEQEAVAETGRRETGEGSLRNHVFENRTRLCGMTSSPAEQMTVDVVAMLYEFILRDGQIPTGVRADLGRTQFLLLKHGLSDPGLFSQPDHPARRLLNRIGSVSLGFSPADPVTLAIRAEIGHAIDQLTEAPAGNTEIFDELLSGFERFVDNTLRAGDTTVGQAVTVLEHAERRAQEYARASKEIAELLLRYEIDPYLRDFLVDAWALVVERMDRKDPEGATVYRRAVPLLIWSAQPKQSNEDRVQMLKLLPDLVGTIHSGLALTRWDAARRQGFLDWLVNAHVHAIRDNLTPTSPSLSELELHFADFIAGQHAPQSLAELQRFDSEFVTEVATELDIALELLDQQLDRSEVGVVGEDTGLVLDEHYRASVLKRLRTGIMIEFTLGDLPRRARLNWVSPQVASILLTVEEMAAPAAISVHLFRRLLASGHIRFMESEPMFERAVALLLRTADEMEGWLGAQAQAESVGR